MIFKRPSLLSGFIIILILSSCAASPPKKPNDICSIFLEKRSWYKAAIKSSKRWKIPLEVNMAFILQESSYIQGAKPERTKLLGFIPWKRKSSAYGYAQALDGTWERYKKEAKKTFAFRRNFDDSIDFIAWYNNLSHKKIGIPRDNARLLYLAYHEGQGGYKKGSYRNKPWLTDVATTVQNNANRYKSQFKSCKNKLRNPFYYLFKKA